MIVTTTAAFLSISASVSKAMKFDTELNLSSTLVSCQLLKLMLVAKCTISSFNLDVSQCWSLIGDFIGPVRLPISRILSPGLFHLHPSSCWCSIYCSRRSWNITRTMVCEQVGSGVQATAQVEQLTQSQTAVLLGNMQTFIHQNTLREFQ